MSCLNGTCGVPQVSGSIMENLVTLAAPLVNKGLPLIHIMRGGSLGMGDFLFEKEHIKDEMTGRATIVYKLKAGMGSGSKFQRVPTNADCQLEWRELLFTKPSAKLADDVTADNVITVDSIAGLRGIGVGSSIIITQANGTIVRARITGIDGNEITLASGVSITAAEGTCVYR